MTKKLISWLSILTVFLTLLWSCHNEDFAKGEAEPQRNNANFFKHVSSATAKSGVDYVSILEEYNRENDFLTTMPDQKGMPIWDKMQVVDTETATGLMIPLSDDNETMSSVLFATLDDENSIIGVKDYDNKLLENIVYSEKIDKDFREQMFYTFMYMDNKTFGNEDFTNIPKDLFVGKKYNNEYGRIRIKNFTTSTATAQQNGKMIWLQSCGVYWQCSHHGEGSCDNCMEKCHVNICYDVVISVPDGDATPQIPNTSGGGDGGGGAPGPQPPKDPCTLSGTVFYRISQQCNENDNVTDEELLPPQSPCETLQKMIENSTVKNAIDVLKPKTLLDKKEFTQEIERKYNDITQNYDYTTNLREGDSFSSVAATGEFIKGNAHNHPKDGIRIPSLGDIKWLSICQRDIFPISAVAYNITVCANHLSPTDYTTANLYAIATDNKDELNTKLGDLYNRPDLIGKTEDNKRDLLMEEDDLYYEGLNDNPTELEKRFLQKYGNFGLSLYRFNKTTNKWMKLTTDGNTITETPCE
ncbi:hypothetical protein [Chryseobacterium ginsengisoli]